MYKLLQKIGFLLLFLVLFQFSALSEDGQESEFRDSSVTEHFENEAEQFEKIYFHVNSEEEGNSMITKMLQEEFPIISDEAIDEIIFNRELNTVVVTDSIGELVDKYANYYVPKNYLVDDPKILWELNIPEFKSRIYQIYNNDTLLITVWNNVVGAPATKTYTGYYEAFKLRNYPTWKDPDKPESIPTPPGPGNPLGLFVVHYDENSLRYFHGTNQNHLVNKEYRALSHGCVRNDDNNIDKMKRFIVTKVVKSEDLSYWAGSKKSMVFEMKEEDKFPVRIMYKTFNIDSDENGTYLEFFKDCYGYEKHKKVSKFDDPSLLIFSTADNILEEYKHEIKENIISDEQLIPLFQNLITSHSKNKKYYLESFYPYTGE